MKNPKSILLIRFRFLGDILLSTPAVRAIRRHYPQARISYVVSSGYEEAIHGNPHVDEVLVWPVRGSLAEKVGFFLALRRGRYDLVCDWWGSSTSALMAVVSGARIRVGFDYPIRKRAYSHVVKAADKILNAVEVYLQTLEVIGVPLNGAQLDFHVAEKEKAEADCWISEKGWGRETLLGVFPGATWSAKRWPANRVAETIAHMVQKNGIKVIVFEGPKDSGRASEILAHLPEGVRSHVSIMANRSLGQLGGWLKRCKVFLTNDAAPMHVAAALNVPTLAVFGPGNAKIWFPYPAPHMVFQKEVSCCQQNTCVKDHACLNAITVEEVICVLEERL